MIWAAQVVDAAQLCTTYSRHQNAYPKPAMAASAAKTSANFRPTGPHPGEIRIAIVFISQGEYPAGGRFVSKRRQNEVWTRGGAWPKNLFTFVVALIEDSVRTDAVGFAL
jgi:hypothetical protein